MLAVAHIVHRMFRLMADISYFKQFHSAPILFEMFASIQSFDLADRDSEGGGRELSAGRDGAAGEEARLQSAADNGGGGGGAVAQPGGRVEGGQARTLTLLGQTEARVSDTMENISE